MRAHRALLAGVAACGLLGVTTNPASAAGPYGFVVIADSADGFFPGATGCPVLDDDGEVFYTTRMLDEPKRYQLWRWSNGDSETLTQKPQAGGGFLSLSSNDSGAFAVSVNKKVDGEYRNTIYRSDGTTTVKVAQTHSVSDWIEDSLITASGQVAYTRVPGALFLSDRIGHETPVYNRENSDFRGISSIAVRDDMIAFTASIADVSFDDNIYLRAEDGTLTEIAGPQTPGLRLVQEPSIGVDGDVAFRAELDGGGYAIMVGDGGPPHTVADSAGPFHLLYSPTINAAGTVVFEATVDGDPYARLGVYSGPDPERDAILEPGDTLGGSTVYTARSCRSGLNDVGQVGIVAELQDGRTVVVRADPH